MSTATAARVVARRHVSPRLVAGLTLVVAFMNIASVATPGLVRHLEFLADVLPVVGVAAPGVSVALGVLLLGLAQGLSRGKRRAWRIAVGLLGAQFVLQVAQRHPVVAVASLGLLVLLLVGRDEFVGRSAPATRRQAVATGAGLLAASLVLGWLAVTVLDDATRTGLSPVQRVGAAAEGLVGVPSAVTAPDRRASDAVYYLLLSLGVLTLGTTGYLLLRTASSAPRRSAADDAALREVVTRNGDGDSLAYFATRDDRSVAWSANRTACVSYRSVSGVALAAGDPLGPRSEWPGAIAAFVDVARGHAWIPAVVAASQAGAEAWERWGGFTALEFGDEAVLERDRFTLQGRDMRNVRQAVARAVRSGYTVTVARLGDLDPQRTALLRSCADRWRAGDVERGFSMGLGRIDPGRDPDTVLVTAELDGEPQALLVLVPWGRRGLSLDLMRRSPTCESGVNELMISTLMTGLRDGDVERVSLNFAVFRDAIERAERLGAGPATRAWGRLLKTVSRWSQADSLYRFNAKFRPAWQPRYLVYATATGLPRVALAYLDAESFVRLPHLRRPRLGGRSRPASVADEAVGTVDARPGRR